MIERELIREGMVVRTRDGHKLGKVIAIGDQQFQIEKGIFFPKDYVATFDAVAEIRDDELILAHGAEALRSAEAEPELIARAPAEPAAREGVRMGLAEEQLEVEKRTVGAGRVVVTKEVVTEQQQVTVPVERERVHVEHVPASREASASEARFEGESVSIPLEQEEVKVRKRPVLREEVRVAKEAEVTSEQISEPIRREEVRVRTEAEGEGLPSERTEPAREEPVDEELKRW